MLGQIGSIQSARPPYRGRTGGPAGAVKRLNDTVCQAEHSNPEQAVIKCQMALFIDNRL